MIVGDSKHLPGIVISAFDSIDPVVNEDLIDLADKLIGFFRSKVFFVKFECRDDVHCIALSRCVDLLYILIVLFENVSTQ